MVHYEMEGWRCNSSILGTQINFSSGKSLGGGSEINSGLFHLPMKDLLMIGKKNLKQKILIIKK